MIRPPTTVARRPALLVIAIAFLLIQDTLNTKLGVQGPATIAIAGLAVIIMVGNVGSESTAFRRSYVPVTMWLFVFWAAFRMALDPTGIAGIQNWLVWFIFPATVAIVAGRAQLGTVAHAYPAWKWAAFFAALVYLATVVVGGPGTELWYSARGAGWIGLVALTFILPWILYKGGSWIPALIIVSGIVLSESRTPVAIAGAMIIVSFALRDFRGKRPAIGRVILRSIISGGAVLAATVWAVTNLSFLTERFTQGDGYSIGGLEINSSGRAVLWARTAEFWQERPWLGHGPGAAQDFISMMFPNYIAHPHNEYLRILADTGIVGMALWGLGMLGFLKLSLSRLRLAKGPTDKAVHMGALLSVIFMILGCITDNITISIFHIMLIGSLIGLSASRERYPEAEPEPVEVPKAAAAKLRLHQLRR